MSEPAYSSPPHELFSFRQQVMGIVAVVFLAAVLIDRWTQLPEALREMETSMTINKLGKSFVEAEKAMR